MSCDTFGLRETRAVILNPQDAERALHRMHRGAAEHHRFGRHPTWLETLAASAADAATWCRLNDDLGNPRDCLRLEALRPRALPINRWDSVYDVCSARNFELARQPRAPSGARFLLYYPDAELSDGAAEDASRGFFDVYNAPPHGTWVAYLECDPDDGSYGSLLLASVPDLFVELADEGIQVNPEECIRWLGSEDADIVSILRIAGVPLEGLGAP